MMMLENNGQIVTNRNVCASVLYFQHEIESAYEATEYQLWGSKPFCLTSQQDSEGGPYGTTAHSP